MSDPIDRADQLPNPQTLDESDRQLSLMGGIVRPEGLPEAGDGEFRSLKQSGGLLSHGTMIMLLIVAVGAGGLYAMRATQGDLTDAADAGVEARIEQALAKLIRPDAMATDDPLRPDNLSALFRDTDSIVAMFSADPARHQVPIDRLQKDPFELRVEAPRVEAVHVGTPVPATDRGHDALLRKLQLELADLQLQSIMQGARPIAVINGELLQPGQSIGSFTIKQITGSGVLLEAGGRSFTLAMQSPEANRSGNPSRPGLR